MFVSFINDFIRIRNVAVSCQGLNAICCRSFYVKPALFIKLYLTYKLILWLAVVFGFLPMTLLLYKFAQPCYRDLLLAA